MDKRKQNAPDAEEPETRSDQASPRMGSTDGSTRDRISSVDSLLRETARVPDALLPASLIDDAGRQLGHFRLLARLGAGGMGIVYVAEDLRLRRRVALKVLPAELVADEERRRRFFRE